MPDRLLLLGTGDAMGVPRAYCDCSVCQGARRTGENRRLRTSALLWADGHSLWLECSPDFRTQIERAGLRSVPHVVLTHPHHDHIGGLPDLADMVLWSEAKTTVWAAAEVLEVVRSRYPWTARSLNYRVLPERFGCSGWEMRHMKVNHGRNGWSYAFRFEKRGRSWVFCPDAFALSPEQEAFLRGSDLVLLGTGYVTEPHPQETRSNHDMAEALALLPRLGVQRAVFLHLSHAVDIGSLPPLPDWAAVAHDGLVVELF